MLGVQLSSLPGRWHWMECSSFGGFLIGIGDEDDDDGDDEDDGDDDDDFGFAIIRWHIEHNCFSTFSISQLWASFFRITLKMVLVRKIGITAMMTMSTKMPMHWLQPGKKTMMTRVILEYQTSYWEIWPSPGRHFWHWEANWSVGIFANQQAQCLRLGTDKELNENMDEIEPYKKGICFCKMYFCFERCCF